MGNLTKNMTIMPPRNATVAVTSGSPVTHSETPLRFWPRPQVTVVQTFFFSLRPLAFILERVTSLLLFVSLLTCLTNVSCSVFYWQDFASFHGNTR